jgi:hypothetical protein
MRTKLDEENKAILYSVASASVAVAVTVVVVVVAKDL